MSVKIIKNANILTHFHTSLEIYYIIWGQADIIIKNVAYIANKDDVILVNSGISHSLESKEDNMVCHVVISREKVWELTFGRGVMFFCNSVKDEDRQYGRLREIFKELVYSYVYYTHNTLSLEYSILYKLLDCLLEKFQVDENFDNENNNILAQQIIQYINNNFQYSLSLGALAEELYTSKSTLSRVFKKHTGVYFADYVSNLRIEQAVFLLDNTDNNITKISSDCGFSNSSVFNRLFKQKFGLSPSEYRLSKKEKLTKIEDRDFSFDDRIDEKIKEELRQRISLENNSSSIIEINKIINVKNTIPYYKPWDKAINVGSVHNLTQANIQFHTEYIFEQLGFTYARMWGIFTKKLNISDGVTFGEYNFDQIDIALDFLVNKNIIPFFDFSNRPNTAKATVEKEVFYEIDYIEFSSRAIWEDIILEFIKHIISRYGKDTTNKWIFEFAYDFTARNKRDYYLDNNFNYFNMFKFVHSTIKKMLPNALVGGFMAQKEVDNIFLSNFLTFCIKENCLPDFISFMMFPYHVSVTKGESTIKDGTTLRKATYENFEVDQLEDIIKFVSKFGISKNNIYITEWNSTISNRNYLNDSCYRGTYAIKRQLDSIGKVGLTNIWFASDWVSSHFDTNRIANGCAGLITKNSIRKPIFFALQFLNLLGNNIIQKGNCYIVTCNGDNEYFILCYNHKWFNSTYFNMSDEITNPDILDEIFEDDKVLELKISLENIDTSTDYIIKKRTVSPEKGCILSEWKNFEYSKKLFSGDVKYLREVSAPHLSIKKATIIGDRLNIEAILLPHEFTLIHVYQDK